MSHQTQLVMTYPTGAEEWFCNQCGHRFIMMWPPKDKIIVLEVGDRAAGHHGSKGNFSVAAAIQVDPELPPIR